MIPEGWEISNLGSKLIKIVGGGTPSRENPEYWNGNIPWATVKDLTSDYSERTQEYITEKGVRESSTNIIPKNTIITATRMGLGRIIQFSQDVSINQDLKALFPKPGVDNNFLLQWFKLKSEVIQSLGSGSTVKGIRLETLKALNLLLPPLPEQKKIASILSSVDEAIQATQKVIDQTQKVKKGLLQELLTKGIGHTEFKTTEIGEIPVDWSIITFNELCDVILDGTHFSPKSKDGAFLYLTSKNIKMGRLDLSNISYISKEEHEIIYKQCSVKLGDVLLTKDGASTGNCAINSLNYPFSLLSSVAVIRGKSTIVDNEYIFQFLLSPIGQKQIVSFIAGQAITRITLKKISNFKIILPPLSEQKQIVSILSSVDKSIQKATTKKEQLIKVKKGLMQDLLTGKVRVKV